ncbi:signal peptidase I [Candidatus Gillettellia adelgis]
MMNMFTLILVLSTLISGILWCFDRFKWVFSRQEKTVTIDIKTISTADDNKSTNTTKQSVGWLEAVASVFPVLLLVLLIRSFIYEPFQIPSASMTPTLLIGDFILVKKYAYGIKDPVTHTTLIETSHPKRGDIAVFKYPLQPKLDYIKRVIGLPGDRVIYDPVSKHVIVQPSYNKRSCKKILTATYNDSQLSEFVQFFNYRGTRKINNGSYQSSNSDNVLQDSIRLRQCQETLDNVSHAILNTPGIQDQVLAYYQQPGKPIAAWEVPADHYFVMGDNRENSADSRYWGFVPEKNLVGKATVIWMSFEKQESAWPTNFRLSRIGSLH